MTPLEAPVVAIGVGNVLLGDDAVGVRTIERLRRTEAAAPGSLPAGTRLVDGGTLGLHLLPYLDGARGLLLVDAADRGEAPGTVTVRRVATAGGSVGDGVVAGLTEAARLLGGAPRAVTVVEIAVGALTPGAGLSPAVEAALPAITATALCELRALAGPGEVSG